MSDTRQPEPISRRVFFKRWTSLTIALVGGTGLLQACAAPPAPAPEPTAAQAPAAKPASAPTATAVPATQAPAATAPAPRPAPTTAPAAKPAAQKVLKIGVDVPPANFNVLKVVSPVQYWPINAVMSTLTQVDAEKGGFAPELAESWKVASDGSSYTFFLHKNARWHDGKPVTAKDVAYTYKMALNAATGTNKAGRLALIKGGASYTAGKTNELAGINVVDDQTIRFDMEFPNGLFLYETCWGPAGLAILPEHILGGVAPKDLANHRYFTESLVGSGPFKFVKYVPDQYYEVEANPDYYFGRPKIDRMVFNIFKSADTMEVAMGRGEVDIPISNSGGSTTVPALYKKFVTDPRFKVVGTVGSVVTAFGFNHRKEYLQDPRIRQAFLHALDRQKLIERFNAGNGTIVNSFMIHPWYQKPEWAKLYPYDPARARALLKEAGWDSGREVAVMLGTLPNEDMRARVATEQQMLAEVGFKITFQELEGAIRNQKFYETYDYELTRAAWGTFPDPDGFLNFHMTTASQNGFGYANPELDKTVQRGRQTVDQAERVKIYQGINEEMLRNLPFAPIYLENGWWIMNRKFHVPQLAGLPIVSSLAKVPIARSQLLIYHSDVWKFHIEQWEIKES